jgi:hypothetical protein
VGGAARLLVWAQLAFWAGIAVCFAVSGGGLSHNHGFSVYGGQASTAVPWATGFLAACALIWRASTLAYTRELRLLVTLMLLLLLTPDTLNQVFYVAHIVASVALFLYQAILGLWLARDAELRALYAVQIAGGIVAGLSELQWIGLLSPGILAFQVAFGVLLVLAVDRDKQLLLTAHAAAG